MVTVALGGDEHELRRRDEVQQPEKRSACPDLEVAPQSHSQLVDRPDELFDGEQLDDSLRRMASRNITPVDHWTDRGRSDELVIQHDRGSDHDHADHVGHGTRGVSPKDSAVLMFGSPATVRHVNCRPPELARRPREPDLSPQRRAQEQQANDGRPSQVGYVARTGGWHGRIRIMLRQPHRSFGTS